MKGAGACGLLVFVFWVKRLAGFCMSAHAGVGDASRCQPPSPVKAQTDHHLHTSLARIDTGTHKHRGASKTARLTVWDNPEFTAARFMDYRRDLLPVDKAVGLTGICTYKEAWDAVHSGRVSVDGATATVSDMVARNQTLALDGQALPAREEIVCYLLNKPRKVMCTCAVGDTATPGELQKAAQFGTVTDLVPNGPRVVPVGRLDFDSEGLLLLTNDGSLCKLLTCPQFKIPKTYAVLVQSKGPALTSTVPSDAALQRLCADGVRLQNDVLLRCTDACLLRSERVPLRYAIAAGSGGDPAAAISKKRARKHARKQQQLLHRPDPLDPDAMASKQRCKRAVKVTAEAEESAASCETDDEAGEETTILSSAVDHSDLGKRARDDGPCAAVVRAEMSGGARDGWGTGREPLVMLSWVQIVLEEGKNREVECLLVFPLLHCLLPPVLSLALSTPQCMHVASGAVTRFAWQVRKLMDGIGFRVLRRVRTGIGSLQGPCAQEYEISPDAKGGLPSSICGTARERADVDENDASPQAAGVRHSDGSARWRPRLVERGQVLQVGDVVVLASEEVDALFALQREAGGQAKRP